jgi:site-specific DNA-methyltransferase (adenine-specific)
MWEQVKRVLKPRGVFVTTASQPFTSKLVMSNLEWFRHEWTWEKTISANFMNLDFQPRKLHENVLVFGRTGYTFNPQIEQGAPYTDNVRSRTADILSPSQSVKSKAEINNMGTRYPSSVQRFSNPNNANRHPTQKPVALYEYLILTYTNPGDTVLDICAGSGTTGEAAIKTGRNCILIEQKPEYFGIIQNRMAQVQAQPLLFEVSA